MPYGFYMANTDQLIEVSKTHTKQGDELINMKTLKHDPSKFVSRKANH